MKCDIDERVLNIAEFILERRETVRGAAAHFGCSKSTVHKDLSQRLPGCNKHLYNQVRHILDNNKAERHIRGGLATKRKYENRRKCQ